MQGCIWESAHVPHTTQMGLVQARMKNCLPLGTRMLMVVEVQAYSQQDVGQKLLVAPTLGCQSAFKGLRDTSLQPTGLTRERRQGSGQCFSSGHIPKQAPSPGHLPRLPPMISAPQGQGRDNNVQTALFGLCWPLL